MVTKKKVVVEFTANNSSFTRSLGSVRQGFRGVARVLSATNEEFKEMHTKTGALNKRMKGLNNRAARVAASVRRATAGMKGFRMEMLGVMFFGLSLTNFFKGLLKPAFETAGIFEILGTTLKVVFLPIALALMPIILKISEFFMNLSDSSKLLLGKLAILGVIFGTALFVIGQFALGIGAIILVFGGLLSIFDRLIPDVKVLGVNMSSFVEAGLGLAFVSKGVVALKNAVGGALDKMLELDTVKEVFDKVGINIDDSKTAWENFKSLVSGVIDNIKEKFGFKKEFDNVKTGVDGMLGDFTSGIGDMKGLVTDIKLIIDDVLPTIKKLADALVTIVEAGEKIADKIITTKNVDEKLNEIKEENKIANFLFTPPQQELDTRPATLTSSKGAGPRLIQEITNNFNGFTMDELIRSVDEGMGRVVDEVNKQTNN